ncbi:MAG: hypothetical protein K8T20_07610 [Planctomycetes bacterium]|nr:hypothetical protein [Planctomycetota bacterium]
MDVSALYFPSAVALGALHALEPGHAKTLTAAYLIGTKGTKRDAIVLGLSVATTHSFVVIALAAAAIWIGQNAFTDRATTWLQVGSGVVVVLLGIWLVWKRLRAKRAVHSAAHAHSHHHAPEPFAFAGGTLSIVDTEAGERFRVIVSGEAPPDEITVHILRPGNRVEHYALRKEGEAWTSDEPPAEPHEFDAMLEIVRGGKREELPFRMVEPAGHEHSHDGLDDDAHARAHAATLPEYVHQGLRPTLGQIVAFGAAGGMIPCPAAVTVMLLAVSIRRTSSGLLLVAGFSLGLAVTLVAIGLAVVAGLKALGSTGRFAWLSRNAGIVSATVVILSGAVSLVLAALGHHH